MGDQVKQQDIQQDDLFAPTIKSAKELIGVFDKANKEINETVVALDKLAKTANTDTQKGINKVVEAQKRMDTQFKKAQRVERETIKNSRALQKARLEEIRVQKAREVAVDKFNKKQEIAIRQQKREEKALKDLGNEYKQLTRKTNEAQAEFKRLAAAHGVNSRQAKKAKVQFDALDRELRSVNNAARDGRRDVGRYGKAFEKTRGSAMRMLGALGLLGGGFAAFRGIITTISDFDSSIASLGAITGKTGKGLEDLKDKVLEVSNETGKGAKEIAEAMKLVGSAQPELLKNADGLAEVTKQAVILAQAGGIDVPAAAAALTKSMNQFGVSAEEAANFTDILATSQQKGTATIEQISEAMKNAGSVAKASGLEFETTNAILQALAKGGLVGAEAGTKLRSILLKLAKTGREDLNPATQDFNDILNVLKKEVTNVTEAQALFGDENAAAALTLIDQKDVVKELDGALLDHGNASEQAAQNMDTLAGQSEKAVTALKNYILGSEGATAFSNGLKESLKFLANNIEGIVTVLGKAVKAYIAYRVVVKSLKLIDQVKNWKAVNKAVKENAAATNDAKKQAKGFGAAVKAMGIAAAIAGLVELAQAWWDVASGAANARMQTELYGKAAAVAAKTLTGIRANLNKTYQDEINSINLLRAAGTLSAAEAEIQTKQAIIDQQKRIEGKIKEIRLDRADLLLQKERAVAIAKQADLDSKDAFGNVRTDALGIGATVRAAQAKQIVAEMNGLLKGQRDIIDGLRGDHSDLNQQVVDSNLSIIELGNQGSETSGKHTEEVKKETKAYKDLTDSIIAAAEAEEERLGLVEDFAIEDVQIRLQTAIEAAKKEATERGKVSVTLINELIEEEERLLRAQIERIFQADLAQAESDEARALALTKRNQALIRLDEEFGGKQKEILDDLNNDQENFDANRVKSTTDANEEIKLSYKDLFDKLNELGNKAFDREIERSKKSQSLSDQEIKNSKKLEDRLREAAKNQNAIASESLAAQSDITEQKQREKIREAKREERLEELKALWNTLNSFLDQGDNPLQAGSKSISLVGGLKKIFGGLTGFKDGTKGRLGDEHIATFGGVDGHIIRADGSEGILTGEKMDRLSAVGLNTTNDIVNSAIMNQQLMGVPMANAIDDRVGGNSEALEKKLDTLIDISKKNRPSKMHPVFKQGMLNAIVEQEVKNGKVTRNWTRRK